MTISRDRRTRTAWWTLRLLATVHALVVWAQPVLAGGYLGGDYDMLGRHAVNADAVSYTGYALVVVALALWAVGGPGAPAAATAALVAAETGQYLAGQEGALAVHVPLGVVLVVGSALVVVAMWRPAPPARPGRRAAARAQVPA